jgi:hypothetical protein
MIDVVHVLGVQFDRWITKCVYATGCAANRLYSSLMVIKAPNCAVGSLMKSLENLLMRVPDLESHFLTGDVWSSIVLCCIMMVGGRSLSNEQDCRLPSVCTSPYTLGAKAGMISRCP